MILTIDLDDSTIKRLKRVQVEVDGEPRPIEEFISDSLIAFSESATDNPMLEIDGRV